MRKSPKSKDGAPGIMGKSQEACSDEVSQRETPKAKTKDRLKRFFSRKINSSKKSNLPIENCVSKAIAQSTINMFRDLSSFSNEEIVPICHSNSIGNLIGTNHWLSENRVLCNDGGTIGRQNAPMASVESLATNVSSNQSSERNKNVPKIFEEPPSDDHIELPMYFNIAAGADFLSIPIADRSRKSSDNDSAVDMKFSDDTSDQGDRTMSSETDSSRCTSTSLTNVEYSKIENISKLENISKIEADSKSTTVKRTDSATSWRKIKVALVWTPFIQQYARHRYPWIQIAGHQGNFKPGEQGTILKKHTGRESICLQMMCEENLSDFVPTFKGDVEYEGEKYICMQDLLAQFNMPSLMDIKMGTRTYLEEELSKAKSSPKPRQDMYEKMVAVDAKEPTEEEHSLRAVIKPRYMQWRETLSSTLSLGFRIEGIKKNIGTQSRNFKRTRYRHEVKESLLDFIDNDADLPWKFIQRIESLRSHLEDSSFFWDHEFIGSSLLFVHDKSGKANVWMIDFGKTIPLPPKCRIDHRSPWVEGNHEDGYLFGVEQLLTILHEIHSELPNDSS